MRNLPSMALVAFLFPLTATASTITPPAGTQCPLSLDAAQPALTQGQSLTCLCGPREVGTIGDVFGTDIYTGHSDICRAAQHAGAMEPNVPKEITFTALPGCSTYDGSEAHGVVSQDYGAHNSSFAIDGFSDTSQSPACNALPADPTDPLLPPPPPLPPEGEPQEGATGLGWHGTIRVHNNFTYNLDEVETSFNAEVVYEVAGGRYAATGRSTLTMYTPPKGSPGWARIVTTLNGTETGDQGGPIAWVGADRQGRISPPPIMIKGTRIITGASDDGTSMPPMRDDWESAIPDTSVDNGPTPPPTPLSGTWNGSYRPEAPSDPEMAKAFHPWTMEWSLTCSSDCVQQ